MPTDTADALPDLPGVVSISLAAEMLEVSRQTAHQMVKSGQLKAWRVRSAGNDRPVVVDESDVKKMRRKRTRVVAVIPTVHDMPGLDEMS